jgi:hypothetical protein
MPSLRSIFKSVVSELSHAGVWYHQAATTLADRANAGATYLSTLALIPMLPSTISNLMHAEQKVNLTDVQMELLTQAYDMYKKNKMVHGSLYVAREIANVHILRGDHERAYQFLERIAKMYRKQGWKSLLAAVLREAEICASKVQRNEHLLALRLEFLSLDLEKDPEFVHSSKQIEELHQMFEASQEEQRVITIERPTFFQVQAGFTEHRVAQYQPAELHISLGALPSVGAELIGKLTSVHVSLDNPQLNFEVVRDLEGKNESRKGPSVLKWENVVQWETNPTGLISDKTHLVVRVVLNPPDLGELGVINIDLIWENPSHKVIHRYPITNGSSVQSFSPTCSLHTQINVVPLHWILLCDIKGPETTFLDELAPIHLTLPDFRKDSRAQVGLESIKAVVRVLQQLDGVDSPLSSPVRSPTSQIAGLYLTKDEALDEGKSCIEIPITDVAQSPTLYFASRVSGSYTLSVQLCTSDAGAIPGDEEEALLSLAMSPIGSEPLSPLGPSKIASNSLKATAGHRFSSSSFPVSRSISMHTVTVRNPFKIQFSAAAPRWSVYPKSHEVDAAGVHPKILQEDRILLMDIISQIELEISDLTPCSVRKANLSVGQNDADVQVRTLTILKNNRNARLAVGQTWRIGMLMRLRFKNPECPATTVSAGGIVIRWKPPESSTWIDSKVPLPLIHRTSIPLVIETGIVLEIYFENHHFKLM